MNYVKLLDSSFLVCFIPWRGEVVPFPFIYFGTLVYIFFFSLSFPSQVLFFTGSLLSVYILIFVLSKERKGEREGGKNLWHPHSAIAFPLPLSLSSPSSSFSFSSSSLSCSSSSSSPSPYYFSLHHFKTPWKHFLYTQSSTRFSLFFLISLQSAFFLCRCTSHHSDPHTAESNGQHAVYILQDTSSNIWCSQAFLHSWDSSLIPS